MLVTGVGGGASVTVLGRLWKGGIRKRPKGDGEDKKRMIDNDG